MTSISSHTILEEIASKLSGKKKTNFEDFKDTNRKELLEIFGNVKNNNDNMKLLKEIFGFMCQEHIFPYYNTSNTLRKKRSYYTHQYLWFPVPTSRIGEGDKAITIAMLKNNTILGPNSEFNGSNTNKILQLDVKDYKEITDFINAIKNSLKEKGGRTYSNYKFALQKKNNNYTTMEPVVGTRKINDLDNLKKHKFLLTPLTINECKQYVSRLFDIKDSKPISRRSSTSRSSLSRRRASAIRSGEPASIRSSTSSARSSSPPIQAVYNVPRTSKVQQQQGIYSFPLQQGQQQGQRLDSESYNMPLQQNVINGSVSANGNNNITYATVRPTGPNNSPRRTVTRRTSRTNSRKSQRAPSPPMPAPRPAPRQRNPPKGSPPPRPAPRPTKPSEAPPPRPAPRPKQSKRPPIPVPRPALRQIPVKPSEAPPPRPAPRPSRTLQRAGYKKLKTKKSSLK